MVVVVVVVVNHRIYNSSIWIWLLLKPFTLLRLRGRRSVPSTSSVIMYASQLQMTESTESYGPKDGLYLRQKKLPTLPTFPKRLDTVSYEPFPVTVPITKRSHYMHPSGVGAKTPCTPSSDDYQWWLSSIAYLQPFHSLITPQLHKRTWKLINFLITRPANYNFIFHRI